MRRHASTPLPSGRRTSISTTSGRVCSLSCTASAAVWASPTTRKPARADRRVRSPMRTTVWSSTIRTRMGSAGTVVRALTSREGHLRGWGRRASGSSLSSGTASITRVPPPGLGPTTSRPPRRRARSRMLRRPWSRRASPAGERGPRAAAVVGDHQVELVGAEDQVHPDAAPPAWRAVLESASRRICSRCWPASSGQRAAGGHAARRRSARGGRSRRRSGGSGRRGRRRAPPAWTGGGRGAADVVADAVGRRR